MSEVKIEIKEKAFAYIFSKLGYGKSIVIFENVIFMTTQTLETSSVYVVSTS